MLPLLLAVSFHFLTTLDLGGSPLRVGSSDLVLPVLCLTFLSDWFSRGRPALTWRLPHLYGWLFALTVWLLISLVVGYVHTGGWERWALFNKTVGWFILLAYFLIGGWVVWFQGSAGLQAFVRAYLVTGWGISAYCIVMYALYWHGVIQDNYYVRIQGFSDNPNAFGCIVAVMLALQLPYMARGRLFSPWAHRVGFAVAALAFFLAGSRSAFLGLACAVPVLLAARHVNLRETLYGLEVGGAILLVLLYLPAEVQRLPSTLQAQWEGWMSSFQVDDSQKAVAASDPVANRPYFYAFRDTQAQDSGAHHRKRINRDAIRLWRQSPVIGTGLGSFYWEQKRVGSTVVIHNTLIWLLTETGVIGATLFAAFFLVCVGAIARPWKWGDHDPFLMGVLAVLLVVAGASMGTEMLYQRHVWFLLGCALVVRAAAEQTRLRGDIPSDSSTLATRD